MAGPQNTHRNLAPIGDENFVESFGEEGFIIHSFLVT
jgi:hypothetical protein